MAKLNKNRISGVWLFFIMNFTRTWIHNNTHKSILSAILFHFMGNYTGELFNLSPRAEIVQCIATLLLTLIVVFYQGPKTLKKSATMVAFILLPLIASGYTPPPSNNTRSLRQFIQYCDNRIPYLMDQYDIPGVSIALVHAGEPVWSAAWGYADQEHNRKMTTDAICRVESISKSVTAWGALNLVEKGLLDPDAAVQEYLKDFKLPTSPYDGKSITIRTLLSNTSGMRLGTIGKSVEYEPHSEMPSLQEFIKHEVGLVREPGTGFLYSNVGFNLLQLVVEQVSGLDFAAYMDEEILNPLGMNRAGFDLPDTLLSSVPTGYDLEGTPVPVYVYPASASGGLFATAEDIARFVSAGMTGPYAKKQRVLEPESINKLYTPQVEIPSLFGIVADAYGFGHFIENLSDGRKAVWHGGQGHGWMTHFHSVPASGDGIVILTNSQRSWPFMARLLSDWGKWCKVGRIKMGRITCGIIALKVFIAIVVLLSLGLLFLLFRDWRKGRRRPDAKPWRAKGRLLQLAAGLTISSVLIWSSLQPYLMVESIFPGVVGYAGYALLGFALILVTSAFFRQTKNG
ncbi:serine hydrolase [candidate division KSB1 bacterium]|nr:serine hydrolase [candidate division KSB1 bacterium]